MGGKSKLSNIVSYIEQELEKYKGKRINPEKSPLEILKINLTPEIMQKLGLNPDKIKNITLSQALKINEEIAKIKNRENNIEKKRDIEKSQLNTREKERNKERNSLISKLIKALSKKIPKGKGKKVVLPKKMAKKIKKTKENDQIGEAKLSKKGLDSYFKSLEIGKDTPSQKIANMQNTLKEQNQQEHQAALHYLAKNIGRNMKSSKTPGNVIKPQENRHISRDR